MKQKLIILGALILIIPLLSGCTVKLGGTANTTSSATDGGIFKSVNKGVAWVQKNAISNALGKPMTFSSMDTNVLARDPSDRNALYLGLVGEGMIYTYDAGESWQRVSILGRVTPRAIAVDPLNHCVLYTAIDNKLYKTVDCTRTWSQTYFDNDVSLKINAILIDSKNSRNVYMGNSRGDIMQSDDSGASWRVISRVQNIKVTKLMMSPYDNKIIFAGTETKGVYRSKDGGVTWENLDKSLKEFKDVYTFKGLVFSKVTAGRIFLANRYGILQSDNYGDTWKNIQLLTPEEKATINAIAVGAKTDLEMYYTTNTTFYSTNDGGATWTAKKLPTARAGWVLDTDPVDANIIYMGTMTIKK